MENKIYFFLNKEVIFQKGIHNFAIYNLFTGDMNLVNKEIGSILEFTEAGKPIKKVARQQHINLDKVIKVLEDLANKKLGNFYTSRIYIDKYKVGLPREIVSQTPPIISKCYIELPGDCSLDCSFCGNPTLFQCAMCTKVKGNADISMIKSFLSRILQLDCRKLIFHGGDPMINLDQFILLVKFCREQGYREEISVITNGSLINQNIVKLFSSLSVRPIIPVFMAENLNKKSQLINISTLFHYNGVPFTATAVLLEEGNNKSEVQEMISRMKPENILQAVVYNKKHDKRSYYPRLLNTTLRVNADIYYHNKQYHPCLWGTLAISAEGDILPCPHLKKEALSNINEPNFIDAIFENEAIYDYWNLPLSSIDNCRDCAFQLGCMDCRALEMRITGDLYGKRLCSLPEKTGITG